MKLDEDGSGSGLRNGELDVGRFVDNDAPSSWVDGAVAFILRSWNWDVVVDKCELDLDLEWCESCAL